MMISVTNPSVRCRQNEKQNMKRHLSFNETTFPPIHLHRINPSANRTEFDNERFVKEPDEMEGRVG